MIASSTSRSRFRIGEHSHALIGIPNHPWHRYLLGHWWLRSARIVRSSTIGVKILPVGPHRHSVLSW